MMALLTCGAAAGAEKTNVVELSLAECVELALDHNLDIQITRVAPEIARYELELAYAPYDPFFDFSAVHSYSASPGGIDEENRRFPGTKTDQDAFRSGLRGVLPTGLTYSLSGDLARRTGTDGSGNFATADGEAAISLRQPLLKNLWIDSTRLEIRISKNRVKTSELLLRLRVMEILHLVELSYYNLILARENEKVQQQALQLAEQLVADNQKRVKVEAMAELDAKQSQSQLEVRKSDLVAAQRNVLLQENALKSLLAGEYETWQGASIVPTETLLAVPRDFDVQDSWERGLAQRPDVLRAKIVTEDLGLIGRFHRNQLFPQLDLVGGYGHSGLGRGYSGALTGMRDGDTPFYSYGAVVTLPLSMRAARSNYKINRAEQKRARLALEGVEHEVMREIEDAIRVAQTSFQRVATTRSATVFAQEALEGEQKKLDSGKTTTFVVLQLQRDLTTARSAEVQALADYNRALAQLALQEGATLERHKVDLRVE
jgi:outer membrane protein